MKKAVFVYKCKMCGSTCERYQAQRVEFEAVKAKQKKDKMVTDAIIDRVIETKRKGRKR